MKRASRLSIVVIALMIAVIGLQACNFGRRNNQPLEYRHAIITDADTDSWLQIDPADEDVEITWFANTQTSYVFTDLVYKRTGVKINFQNAMSADSSELNTMISGDRLPDVITLTDLSTRVQLAEEGYVYPIDWLAEGYAPSLLKKERRYTTEHRDYYAASDGLSYGIAQDFYNDGDIDEFAELGGNQLSNYDLIVRKDYLEAFIAHKKTQDASYNPDTHITRPSGFLEMCLWVKDKYELSNSNPTVMLSQFFDTAQNDQLNYSLHALMEFFGVPMEDAEGNYVYQYDTPEFIEVMEFLNTLYNERLITSANFGYDISAQGTQILNGRPFATFGSGHTLSGHLAQREKAGYSSSTGKVADTHKYVPIVLTNENGDAPLLMDFAGRGLNVTMITKNAQREDRIIKMFDYLRSEQGIRELTYGEEEGRFYNYVVRPGEVNPSTGKVSTYGVMEWTDDAKTIFGVGTGITGYGLLRQTPLHNNIYTRISLTDDSKQVYADFSSLNSFILYQNKSAFFDYTFPRVPFRYPLDTSDRFKLNDYVTKQSDVEQIWIEALPKMIMAANHTAMKSIYDTALAQSYQAGAEEWTQFRNQSFKSYKEYLGIQYAWPKNDPNYIAPSVTLYGASDTYRVNIPAWAYGK